ncbi:MAG: cob(I)yrinic acid a,c-diamide adenosyltransferase [Defluviitaleaceae bacterium]|nr:cob(I)yrinic acid a,c-diamide adenosyltransferase [Defluviitaleaceae bacterium]
MSIYTRTGDNGKTMLQNGNPIPKHHPIVQAMAALDELNAHIGIIKSQASQVESIADYEKIQKNIMTVLSLISTAEKPPAHSWKDKSSSTGWDDFFEDEVAILESGINAISSKMPPAKSFVTYGANPKSANLDLARAIARRAETKLTQIAESSGYAKATLAYINRLSDFLYIKARYADFEQAVTQAVSDALNKTKTSTTCSTNDINLAQAKTILEIIEHKACELDLSIVAACVNAAGNPVAVHVMDNALLVSYEAALAKAYTAAALKMSTADLSQLVQPGQQFYGLEAIGDGKILPIGGGIPLYNQQGNIVGAVGVSGGTAAQDHELAAAARF